MRAVIRHAPTIAGGFIGGTLNRRLLREVARRTTDGAAAQRWWRELRRDFDVLLNRAVRQRNRVIHGRQPVPAVIASVDDFIAGLSATLAQQALTSVGGGQSVDTVLDQERQEFAELFDALPAHDALALFGI